MPLHAHLWMVFGSLVLFVGLLATGINYWMTQSALQTATAEATQRMAGAMRDEVEELLAPAQTAIKLIRYSTVANDGPPYHDNAWLALAREALESAPILQAVYIGYKNGAFRYVRRLQTDLDRTMFQAPSSAAYVLRSVTYRGPAPVGELSFLDSELRTLGLIKDQDYAERFDPRKRVWYIAAIASDVPVRIDPYLFFADQEVGTTFAVRTPQGTAVVGGDFRLDWLGTMLARKKATAGTMLALLDSNGKVLGIDNRLPDSSNVPDSIKPDLLATPADYGIPILTAMASALGTGQRNDGIRSMTVDGLQWYTAIDPMPSTTGKPLYLLTAVPRHELLADARSQAWRGIALTFAIVLVSIPLTWVMARRIATPLRHLADGVLAIRSFDFDKPLAVGSMIREVRALGGATEQMRQTIRRFLLIVQAIAAEDRLDRLLPVLLMKTLGEAGGKAGVFYLVDEERITVGASHTLNGSEMPVPPLVHEAIREASTRSGLLGGEGFDTMFAVAIPLLYRNEEVRGVILVMRDTPMEPSQLAFVETLSRLFAGAIEIRALADDQARLFDAFIRLLADAIDAKSPHTGGHCSRVPPLTKMLAQAACDATDGPFRSFDMTPTEWDTLHIAAWLHDCGKITTPEFVIDKGTKLETLHDRLHEVRMRFEVIKRDAEIRCLESIAVGADTFEARSTLQRTLEALDDDFAFVAQCNQGGETMDDGRKARLLKIATQTWKRTLDDRIGLSHAEISRRTTTPVLPLPVFEPLLADKPEHRELRTPRDVIEPDNAWGFKRSAPRYLYNRGELHNLLIARGTLCEEERYKIEDHIVQTQIMLSRLPFPRHLRQVPEVAGNHHEKMDGTGYPRGLRRDEMSPLSRMMAVADIFEALTAADRPYKRSKTLSESLAIMARATAEGHIDPEIFDLFLSSGTYRTYAERYMHPAQIDAVDIAHYLAAAHGRT